MSSTYFRQLMRVVLAHSKGNTWQEAKNEWHVSSEMLDNPGDYDTCICGYHPITDLYQITNDETGETLFPIGSVCIKKFESSRMIQGMNLATQTAKLMLYNRNYFAKLDHLDSTVGFSRKIIDWLYTQGVFPPTRYNHQDPWKERQFMMAMFNRRNELTPSQKYRLHCDLVEYVYPFLHAKREQLRKDSLSH